MLGGKDKFHEKEHSRCGERKEELDEKSFFDADRLHFLGGLRKWCKLALNGFFNGSSFVLLYGNFKKFRCLLYYEIINQICCYHLLSLFNSL